MFNAKGHKWTCQLQDGELDTRITFCDVGKCTNLGLLVVSFICIFGVSLRQYQVAYDKTRCQKQYIVIYM